MKLIKYPAMLLAIAGFFPIAALAQKEDKEVKEKTEVEQIIITRKGDNKEKVVVEIDGDNVMINGKPASEYKGKDGAVTIRKNKEIRNHIEGLPRSPRGETWNFSDGDKDIHIFSSDENHAMLGVSTEKVEGGVKVNTVTKGSAAEKIGLKEGDVITKIDNKEIKDPDELAEAIRAHKPGDKVKVTYLRDKKEQTKTAELTKWKGMNTFSYVPGQPFNLNLGDMDFDFKKIMPKIQSIPQLRGYGQNWNWSDNSPKLGLTVQDTDDGNGVKVIEVDEESNAAMAGIKKDDIITEVNGTGIKGTDDMVKMMKDNKDKISMMVKLQRNGKTQNIEVKMPRKIKTADL